MNGKSSDCDGEPTCCVIPKEIDNKNPKLWPLRRAAAMLVSAWVSKLKKEDRKLAYRSLVGLLSEKDYCLKLTAVDVFRILIDDWAFREEDFLEYSSATLGNLASMVEECEDLDTQVKVRYEDSCLLVSSRPWGVVGSVFVR